MTHDPEKYNIEPESITVSGFASGGSMAQQFHYAHSAIVKGVGSFSSGWCFNLLGKFLRLS